MANINSLTIFICKYLQNKDLPGLGEAVCNRVEVLALKI